MTKYFAIGCSIVCALMIVGCSSGMSSSDKQTLKGVLDKPLTAPGGGGQHHPMGAGQKKAASKGLEGPGGQKPGAGQPEPGQPGAPAPSSP